MNRKYNLIGVLTFCLDTKSNKKIKTRRLLHASQYFLRI
jgi:hypothetical protein